MTFSADIWGTAEQICDKFTRKTCLVSRSDEFEGYVQFQRPAYGLCMEKHLCSIKFFFAHCVLARGPYIFLALRVRTFAIEILLQKCN